MGAIAQVKDGEIVKSNSAESLANSASELNKKGLGKDAFMGMLVAQMKYQDPLQPTSNTEFISQYATFSSLEQMQNVSASMDLARASSLVGQVVTVNTTDSKGGIIQLQGKVEYVRYENSKAYVSIGGALYALDDVSAVADQEYLDAYDLAYDFCEGIRKLPSKEKLTLDDKEDVDKLNKTYKEMSDYEKTFVAADFVKQLKELTERMEELVKDKEENNGGEGGDDSDKDDDDSGKTDTDNTTKTE